mmetsp:Transcript_5188/g.14516  ORF Transcript_5188/g.14516 Transcript_5188/m.14516 type:complete len:193 (+) Transcript_5188:944-1522(+)
MRNVLFKPKQRTSGDPVPVSPLRCLLLCSVCHGKLEICCCSENPALVVSWPDVRSCTCKESMGWAAILLVVSSCFLSVCAIFFAVGWCYGLWQVDNSDTCTRLLPNILQGIGFSKAARETPCFDPLDSYGNCFVVDASCQVGSSSIGDAARSKTSGQHGAPWMETSADDSLLWDGKKSVPSKHPNESRLLSY